MKYTPILFSGPMVRAILDGSKTQTRRIIKRTDTGRVKAIGSHRNWHLEDPHCVQACPQGKPGDQLWVRETWATTEQAGDHAADACIVYRATDPDWQTMEGWKWKPSIFLPRAYSRITLEITDIRVQRLNDITEADAKAEGVEDYRFLSPHSDFRAGFLCLWESINGPGSWQDNPYVWAITFNRIKP